MKRTPHNRGGVDCLGNSALFPTYTGFILKAGFNNGPNSYHTIHAHQKKHHPKPRNLPFGGFLIMLKYARVNVLSHNPSSC